MTMRVLIIVMSFVLFDSCRSRGPIDVNSIRVVRYNQHPMFNDHDRKLITVDINGDIIDELELYPDTGIGCNSYLFESEKTYILIDCNGQWFHIDKRTGDLEKDEWEWRKALPQVELGFFKRQDSEVNYKLLTGEKISMDEVYKYKDPNE